MKDKDKILEWYREHSCDTPNKIKNSIINEENMFVKAGVETKEEAEQTIRERLALLEIE